MSQCGVTTCTNEDLVFSGIDAFCLGGIPTETYCYSCANAYNQITQGITWVHTTKEEVA
jgi:hypothetical protein